MVGGCEMIKVLEIMLAVVLLPFRLYHQVSGRIIRHMNIYEKRHEALEDAMGWVLGEYEETPINY